MKILRTKTSVVFLLLLSACQTPTQENPGLSAFRSCQSYGPGTQEFDNCMKEHEAREKNRMHQEKTEFTHSYGGRNVVREKKTEAEFKAPRPGNIMIPKSLLIN